jgi:hypothetical protein
MLGKWMDWIVVDDVVVVVVVVDAVVVVVFKICDKVGKILANTVLGLLNRIVSEEKWRMTLGSELNPELNPELNSDPDPVPELMTSLISERLEDDCCSDQFDL